MKKTLKGIAAAVGITAAGALGVGLAGPALADTGTVSTDTAAAATIAASQFTADVTNAGFYNQGGPGAQMVLGVSMCNAIDAGSSPLAVAHDLYLNSNLTAFRAGQFVGIAVRDLCPWNGGAITGHGGGPVTTVGAS
jgi:hypothetical protein